MTDTHTISMAASNLDWDDVDERAKKIGFKDRSKYIQYLAEKDITKSRFEKIRIFEIVVLIEMSVILMLLVLV